MLLHGIGVSIEDGLEHIGDELLHLLRCTAHKVLRHKARHDLLAGQAKGRVGSNTVHHIVGQALFLDLLAGGDGVLAQTLVQLLTVAALFHSLHHDVLAGHEGQLCHQTAAHHLGIHHDAVGDVEHDVQDSVSGKEALSHGDTLVGAVVQRALKPLGAGGEAGVQHIYHQVAAQCADTLAAHGVALVRHGGGTDLVLFKRLFHLLEVSQQTQVGGKLHAALANAGKGVQDEGIHLAAVGLAGHRNDGLGVKAHLLGDGSIHGADLIGIALEQLHKRSLRAGGTLDTAQLQNSKTVVDLLQVHHQLVGPQGGALAHGGGLSGLAVSVGHAGHVLVFLGEAAQLCQHTDQLFAHQFQTLTHHDDVGVVAHIAAGGTQMDDAGSLGALLAVGVHMAHHVVAHQLFALDGHFIVDIVHMGFQLSHHIGGDVGQALLHFGPGQRHPQAAPCAELVIVREDILHLVRGIAGGKGADITIMLRH